MPHTCKSIRAGQRWNDMRCLLTKACKILISRASFPSFDTLGIIFASSRLKHLSPGQEHSITWVVLTTFIQTISVNANKFQQGAGAVRKVCLPPSWFLVYIFIAFKRRVESSQRIGWKIEKATGQWECDKPSPHPSSSASPKSSPHSLYLQRLWSLQSPAGKALFSLKGVFPTCAFEMMIGLFFPFFLLW